MDLLAGPLHLELLQIIIIQLLRIPSLVMLRLL